MLLVLAVIDNIADFSSTFNVWRLKLLEKGTHDNDVKTFFSVKIS